MLFGGFAPPAARQTSAVFFMYYAPQSFALLIGISKGHVATDTALSLFLLPCAGLVQPVAPKKILIFVVLYKIY